MHVYVNLIVCSSQGGHKFCICIILHFFYAVMGNGVCLLMWAKLLILSINFVLQAKKTNYFLWQKECHSYIKLFLWVDALDGSVNRSAGFQSLGNLP